MWLRCFISYCGVSRIGFSIATVRSWIWHELCPLTNNDNDSVIKLIVNRAADTYFKIQKLIFDDITKNETRHHHVSFAKRAH